jgi:hypothetical protein
LGFRRAKGGHHVVISSLVAIRVQGLLTPLDELSRSGQHIGKETCLVRCSTKWPWHATQLQQDREVLRAVLGEAAFSSGACAR